MAQYGSPIGDVVDQAGVDITTGATKIDLKGDLAGAGFGQQRMTLDFGGAGSPVNAGNACNCVRYANQDDVSIVRTFVTSMSLIANRYLISQPNGSIGFTSLTVLRFPGGQAKFRPFVAPLPPALPEPVQSDGSKLRLAIKATKGFELVGGSYPGLYAADGTKIVYSTTRLNSADGPGDGSGATSFLADSVTFPDGEVWKYYYNDLIFSPQSTYPYGFSVSRIKFITSNRGYGIQFSYGVNQVTSAGGSDVYLWMLPNTVKFYNKSSYYCNEAALVDCPAISAILPSAQLSYSQNTKTMTVTLGGVTKSYRYQRYAKFGIPTIMPDLELASVENTAVPGSLISYSYIYDSGRLYGGAPSCAPGSTRYHYITNAVVGGNTWQYGYGRECSNSPVQFTQLYRIAPSGGVIRNTILTAIGQTTKYIDELTRSSEYEYSGFDSTGISTMGLTPKGYMSSLKHPDGDMIKYQYDARGNVTEKRVVAKPGSGQADIVEAWTYPTECLNPRQCNKPLTHIDSNGNDETFTYDAAHGGVLTRTGPLVSGVRPVTRYGYIQRTAWILNSVGSYVAADTPVWLLETERSCRTSATVGGACAAGSGDETTVTFDYGPDSGPNNLLVRGRIVTASGVSLRTCYGYDATGNKIFETAPRAGLAVCS